MEAVKFVEKTLGIEIEPKQKEIIAKGLQELHEQYQEPSDEQKKRTLSWTYLVVRNKKQSYSGTVTPEEKAKRRKKARAARVARRLNRG